MKTACTKNITTEGSCKKAPETFYIKITSDGPYMVYGCPPIHQEVIVPNAYGHSWEYRKGEVFNTLDTPVCLCRCGGSAFKPYCDGSHDQIDWNPVETALKEPFIEGAEKIEGPEMILIDNEKYCAYARFCDVGGRIWNIVKEATTEEDIELLKHEAGHCPAGRLVLWNKTEEKIYEPDFEPSIGILEDPGIKVSGPMWVKGGIRIESADGTSYEIRNRVTLCRCGQSSNKPFCDGTHASMHFKDELPTE